MISSRHKLLGALGTLLCAVLMPMPARAGKQENIEDTSTRNVAIVMYDGVEVLDFAGPAEVFEAADTFDTTEEPAFHLYTVAASAEAITSQGFIEVLPDFSYENAPAPDILVVPGGRANPVAGAPEFLEWVRSAADEAEVVMSVCSGAFLLGEIGMLDGQRATTWYNALPGLARRFPEAEVLPGVRFVDNGKVLTTAGVSAGIDGALHLVARLLGRHVADQTAEYMEYDWAPPAYLAQHYRLIDPRLDRAHKALQLAEIQRDDGDLESAAHTFRQAIDEGAGTARAWYGLGSVLFDQGASREALDAFSSVPRGRTSSRRYEARSLYNASRIAVSLGDLDRSLELLAEAIDHGFRNRSWTERDSNFEPLLNDPRFEALLERMQ